MDEKYDHTQDDMVKDLNLEAKIDKELFLHGFLRSDFTDDELKTLRDEIAMLQQGNCSVLNGFWSSKKSRKKKSESEDVEPIPKFAVGDRVWVTETEGVEIGEAVHLGAVVDLVGCQYHWFWTFAQHFGHIFVHWGEPFACIDKEEDDVSLVDSEGDLLANLDLEFVVAAHDVAAGVDDREVLAVPVGVAVLAVAGDAADGVDDSVATLGEAVEEG